MSEVVLFLHEGWCYFPEKAVLNLRVATYLLFLLFCIYIDNAAV